MKKLLICLVGLYMIGVSCKHEQQDSDWIRKCIDVSEYQLTRMASQLAQTDSLPRSIRNGEVRLVAPRDWTSGFFPGSLWLAYELTGNDSLKFYARQYTRLLEELQFYKGTHDLGFMVFCSYGNALRLAPEEGDREIILNAAESLSSRFSEETGLIRSWDFGEWKYPVIIDNMMNLEMLFWAAQNGGNDRFREIAVKHADVTIANHFREDYSSYHVVSFDPASGEVESRGTFQGLSDSSSWARGQAWGLYGYTTCYRETRDQRYLDMAKAIAHYIMTHPAIPEDKIPLWDYNDPRGLEAPRDASAAAITASALLELGTFVGDGKELFDYAEEILKTLATDEYLAPKGENAGFILKHSVGHLPANSEIDTPLNYADYYFLEAIKRYAQLKDIKIRP